MVLHQHLNFWNSFLSGIFLTDSSSRVVDVSRSATWRCFLDPPSTSSWVVKTVHCCLPGLLHGEVVRVAIRDGNFTSHWEYFWALRIWRVLRLTFKYHCQTTSPKCCNSLNCTPNLSSPETLDVVTWGRNSLLTLPNINCKHSSFKPMGATS